MDTFSEKTKFTAGIVGAFVVGVLYVAALRADNTAVAVQSARSEQRINAIEDKMEVLMNRSARQETLLEILVERRNKRQ